MRFGGSSKPTDEVCVSVKLRDLSLEEKIERSGALKPSLGAEVTDWDDTRYLHAMMSIRNGGGQELL